MIVLEHILSSSRMSVAAPLEVILKVYPQRLLIIHSLQPKSGVEPETNGRIKILQEKYQVLDREARISTFVKDNWQHYTIPLFNSLHVQSS